jgi:hypothetical protein
MEGAVLDSAPWKCVEAVPAIGFSLEGNSAVRVHPPRRKTSITAAEGRVTSIADGRLWLTHGNAASLKFSLPRSIDLHALVDRRVRMTLRNEPLANGPISQLLTIADADGRARLIAHYGPVQGQVHSLGTMDVCASLSQRQGGPMIFGTSLLQCVVFAGEEVTIHDGTSSYVMHFVARMVAGYAAYVIVERSLWRL